MQKKETLARPPSPWLRGGLAASLPYPRSLLASVVLTACHACMVLSWIRPVCCEFACSVLPAGFSTARVWGLYSSDRARGIWVFNCFLL